MTDSVQIFPPGWRLTTSAGDPVPGGWLKFYAAGTTTPFTVYSDSGLSVSLGSQVYLNSTGQPVASSGSPTTVMVYTGTAAYKVEAYDADGVLVPGVTQDNVRGAFPTPDVLVWTETALTGSHTVLTSEDGAHFSYTGTGGHTVTLPDPANFPSLFTVRITNAASTRFLKVAPSGFTRIDETLATVTYFWVYPGTTAEIINVNGTWKVTYNFVWETLNYVTVWVDPTNGNDENDGMSFASGKKTIYRAIRWIEAYLNCLLLGPTIQVGDGSTPVTFTENDVVHTKCLTGNHVMTIVGNLTTPGNCIWQCDSGRTCFTARDTSMVILRGFRMQQASGSGATLLSSSQHGVVDYGGKFEFGDCTGGYHISSVNGGSVGTEQNAQVEIVGTSYAGHWLCTSESNILITLDQSGGGSSYYKVAAGTFTSFANLIGGTITMAGFEFTGAGANVGSTGSPYSSAGACNLLGFWNGQGAVTGATIAAAGGSGTNGTAVYRVVGGTGTAAELNVTIAGGVLSAVNSVKNAGNYTVFPTSPASLTYVSGTGTGLVGATVNLTGSGSSSGIRLPGNGTPTETIYPQAQRSGVSSTLGTTNYEWLSLLLRSGGSIQCGDGSASFTWLNSSAFWLSTVGSGFGYGTGTGGAVTQTTSKSTGVTLNKPSGKITMVNDALGTFGGGSDSVSFTLTNNCIAATDTLILSHAGGGTHGTYFLSARCGSGSADIYVRNLSTGTPADAIQIQFTLLKGAIT